MSTCETMVATLLYDLGERALSVCGVQLHQLLMDERLYCIYCEESPTRFRRVNLAVTQPLAYPSFPHPTSPV